MPKKDLPGTHRFVERNYTRRRNGAKFEIFIDPIQFSDKLVGRRPLSDAVAPRREPHRWFSSRALCRAATVPILWAC